MAPDLAPADWIRGPREAVKLDCDPGVYALFLRKSSRLPGLDVQGGALLYIGRATGARGLLGRCHFEGKTQNHSPRKSLAVLLRAELGLVPVHVRKPNSSDTWGLDKSSEYRLRAWMYQHLDLAIEVCNDPATREAKLISRYAPPLNLNKCPQSEQHQAISMARRAVMMSSD